MVKDVTVTKLSRLQKQILIYARRAMLAKGQKIEPRNDVTVCIPAPPWLDKVLNETLSKIFEVRHRRLGTLRHTDKLKIHDWIWFFEEIQFFQEAISKAAKEAGQKVDLVHFKLTNLFEFVAPMLLLAGGYVGKFKWSFSPWPHYDNGWFFVIEIEGLTPVQIMDEFVSSIGEKEVKKTGLWLNANPQYPVNCTIPELLRDLFGFPVSGTIDGLAFSPEQIGQPRYNSAQAALRRACTRLRARKLIWQRAGQVTGLYLSFYERSGIGLTEKGIAVADTLIAEETKQAA
jgi:hypothetical protein